MQVTAAQVSNNHESFISYFYLSLCLILSPLKGVISNSLLQVAIEMVHKLRINYGMMLGVWMMGVIRIMSENPTAVPGVHFHF
jgi:hypothetical protein